MSKNINKPNQLLIEKAIIKSNSKTNLIEKSEIYTDSNGVEYQFRRIKPMIVDKALAYINSLLRLNEPKPPIQRISGKEQPNPQHPEYQRDLEIWKQEKEEITNDKYTSLFLMLNIGTKLLSPIPDKELWLDDVCDMIFAGVGTKEDKNNLLKSMYRDEAQMVEFLYKRYVLFDQEVMDRMVQFHSFNTNEVVENTVDVALAVDTFPVKET